MINNIVILPEPVEFFLMKGSANDDLITSAVFPGMEEEAYRIRAEEKGITILAGSEKGLKRAEASLSQIRLQCYFGGQAAVPCFRLYDRPKQRERIYRTSGLKSTEVLRQKIRIAAFLKYNVFELVLPGAFSDMKALEETCSGFGMEFRYTGETSVEKREGITAEEEINGWHSAPGCDRITVLRRAAERAEALWRRERDCDCWAFPGHDDREFPEQDSPGFRERFERLLPFLEMILDPEDPGEGDLTT
ncbi:MAG: hypothetical protein IJL98_06095 [Lachnospiraceae bacterium]|nr:hypothetical protein [Lachnospiraceae bacterium]